LIVSAVVVGDAGDTLPSRISIGSGIVVAGRLCWLYASADNGDTQCAGPQTAQHGTTAHTHFCGNILIRQGFFYNAFGFWERIPFFIGAHYDYLFCDIFKKK
jgi:hypothetical protein